MGYSWRYHGQYNPPAMLFASKSVIPLIALLSPSAQAWGTKTNRIIKHIVEPQYDGSIGRAAAWADECGRTDEGKDSPTWHYINPADNAGTKNGRVLNGLPVVNGCAEGSVADVEDEGAGDSSSDRREKGRSG
ncbi:hypothetical protein RJZ57_007566 [Blastomyces gilchristii]